MSRFVLPTVTQADRNRLADAWERWRGMEGVVRKLRDGGDFMTGSPVHVCLMAIAGQRLEYEQAERRA